MKFSALNVDFSNLSPDPLGSRRPAHASQRGVPLLKVVIYPLLACLAWKWLQNADSTDMLLNITSTVNKLLWLSTLMTLITLNSKNRGFSDFLAIFGCKKVNWDEMDEDRPRLPANRNCYRLSRVSWALARISCFKDPQSCSWNISVRKLAKVMLLMKFFTLFICTM